MDWHSRFQHNFFDLWQKAGLPQGQDFLKEYIDIREHGYINKTWIYKLPDKLPGIDGSQLRSVYGFGATTGKIFAGLFELDGEQEKKVADWCGRFNLGISLFDYICDEMDGVKNITSLAVFQSFSKSKNADTGILSPVGELLSQLAVGVLHDLNEAALKKGGSPKADQLFKTMKRMFEAENFVSNKNIAAVSDFKKIQKCLYLKSAEPFRMMAEFSNLLGYTDDSLHLKKNLAVGKALGYCYWLIDDAKDVWDDLKAGQWNLFLTMAAAVNPSLFVKGKDENIENRLIEIWEQSNHAEKISRQIINRLLYAVTKLKLPEDIKHHNLGLVWASLWQWSYY